MISRVIKKTVELNKIQKVDQLEGPLYQLENAGHTFEITCLMNGAAADISGTVSGRFLRADETTVYFTGTLDGSVASITLPQSCYNVNGRFGFVVFVSGSNVTTAIYAVAGSVYKSTSDTIIDPTGEIPSLEELLAEIDACEAATAAATAASAFVPNVIASAYSASSTYAVGDYCTKDGYLYQCNTAISTAEAWTAAHWTQCKVGGELSDLKSATAQDFAGIITVEQGYWAVTNGSATNSTEWCRTTKFVNMDFVVKTTTSRMYLLAFNKVTGAYVGTWNKKVFNTTYNSSLALNEYNISEFAKNYPDYMFAIDFKRASGNLAPSDVYAELTIQRVSEKRITDVSRYGAIKKWEPSDMVNGTWDSRNISASTKRICSASLIDVNAGDVLSIESNPDGLCYAFGVYVGSSSDSSSGYSGWLSNANAKHTIQYTGKLFVQVATATTLDASADISPSDFTIDMRLVSECLIRLNDIENIKTEMSNQFLINDSAVLFNREIVNLGAVSGDNTGLGVGIAGGCGILTLNGTSGSKDIKIRLNDDIERTVNDTRVEAWPGMTVPVGTYRVQLKYVSGTVPSSSVSVSVYKTGTSSTIGTGVRDGLNYTRTFESDGSNYNIVLYIESDKTFVNGMFYVSMVRVEEESVFGTVTPILIMDDGDSSRREVPQGGCLVNGDLLYCYIESYNLVKYNIKNKQTTKVSYADVPALYNKHNNDMTYNPITGKIYVATMANGVLVELDAATLNVTNTYTLLDGNGTALPFSGIAYDRKNNRYITYVSESNAARYAIYDSSFAYVSEVNATVSATYTSTQGIECDGNYIYMCLSGTKNQILVIDFDGVQQTVCDVGVSGTTWEIEGLQYDWDKGFYMNGNVKFAGVQSSAGCSFYYLATNKEPTYSDIVKISTAL